MYVGFDEILNYRYFITPVMMMIHFTMAMVNMGIRRKKTIIAFSCHIPCSRFVMKHKTGFTNPEQGVLAYELSPLLYRCDEQIHLTEHT